MGMTAMEQKQYEGLTVFQRAKMKFGVSHPAEQMLILEARVAKVEELLKAMLKPELKIEVKPNVEVVIDEPSSLASIPAKKMGRPKGSKNK